MFSFWFVQSQAVYEYSLAQTPEGDDNLDEVEISWKTTLLEPLVPKYVDLTYNCI